MRKLARMGIENDVLTGAAGEQLYSLFKQGTQDPPIDESPQPGMFDMAVRPLLSHLFPDRHFPFHDCPPRPFTSPNLTSARVVMWRGRLGARMKRGKAELI